MLRSRPFGYVLHRQLEKLGIHNVVVRPQDWDDLHKGVKTDKTDALALAQRLSRYVDGNLKELAVIRVPTPEQEMARSQSRQREQLMAHRQRREARDAAFCFSTATASKATGGGSLSGKNCTPNWPPHCWSC